MGRGAGVGAARGERLFEMLSGENADERACKAIPESACTEVPANYLLNVANGSCTKLAEQLASPGLVLPWLLAAIGAPSALAGFLMPLKQAGSLVPQLAVAARIRSAARRKWFWVGAGATQAVLLLFMIPAVLLLPATAAGIAVLVLLAAFSIASGVGSVAFQDVMGKTIPKGGRGRLLSNRAAIGGGLTLVAGIGMRLYLDDDSGLAPLLMLIGAAAVLWAAGAALFAAIAELPGATEGGRNMLGEVRGGFRLVGEVPGYRAYLIVRALLLSVELATPFFAVHAQALYGEGIGALGVYVVAVGFAEVVSSPFWGGFSDAASRSVLFYSGLLGAAAGLLALAVGWLPGLAQWSEAYALVFIVLGLAIAGVRLGRKTYLVDAAPADERPLYVAFSNTAIGLVALVFGSVGFVLQAFGPEPTIALLALLAGAGALASRLLPSPDAFAAQGR